MNFIILNHFLFILVPICMHVMQLSIYALVDSETSGLNNILAFE